MIQLIHNDKIICKSVKVADSFISRLFGLMFKTEVHKGFDCLHIKPTNSIHTFFMRFNIDVIFVSKKMKVIKVVRSMKPWRMTRLYFSAHSVFEMKGGQASGVKEGDILEVKNV